MELHSFQHKLLGLWLSWYLWLFSLLIGCISSLVLNGHTHTHTFGHRSLDITLGTWLLGPMCPWDEPVLASCRRRQVSYFAFYPGVYQGGQGLFGLHFHTLVHQRGQCRNWDLKQKGGLQLNDLLPWLAQPAFYTIQDLLPGVVSPTVDGAIPHQSFVKTMPHRIIWRPIWFDKGTLRMEFPPHRWS